MEGLVSSSVTIDAVFASENVELALEMLEKKHDSSGIDGIKLSEIREYWKIHGEDVVSAISEGSYYPGTTSLVEILKSNGKRRIIAKLNSVDRLILRCIEQILDPIAEKTFEDSSFAYRNNRSAMEAAGLAADYLSEGYEWVCETDIKGFFDSIDHDILLSRLTKGAFFESRLLLLVERYIRCRVELGGEERVTERGLIQGSPLSPILSNIYLTDLDKCLNEQGIKNVRYGDDINLYFTTVEEAYKYRDIVKNWLYEIGLTINEQKSGIYKGENRSYLGYEFVKTGKRYIIKKSSATRKQVYNRWRRGSIEKIDNVYHIVNSGILTRRDFTMLFEGEEGKYYLPIETIKNLNVYSDITFSSRFFEFVSENGLSITFIDPTGTRIGTYYPTKTQGNYKTELSQVAFRQNIKTQLPIAKKYQNANIFNLRAILRYYARRGDSCEINNAIEFLTEALDRVNEAKDINGLMIVEAQSRQRYYRCFNNILKNEDFTFTTRTKRPPKDALNALISFGNTLLYQRFASLIFQSSLDIRFGILHNSYHRSESLNLDLADLFKPVLVDRAIFTIINKNMITKADFQSVEDEGIYLNPRGKRVFIKEFEKKLYQQIKIGGKIKNYDSLLRDEVRKVEKFFNNGEKYKPYKYVN